eukprot:COSAG05_NODE_392_length_10391_cov_8.232899_8_plen_319_part_00
MPPPLLSLLPLLPLWAGTRAQGTPGVAFHPPVMVGESNWSHFWMPSSLFKGEANDILMAVDLAGDGKPCPPPHHPQNCSALFRSQDSGLSWGQVYGSVPGMALPIPQHTPGKTRTFNFDGKAAGSPGQYEVFSAMWLDTPAGVQRVGAESVVVPLLGFPPLAGPPAMSGNVVRLRNSSTLIGTMCRLCLHSNSRILRQLFEPPLINPVCRYGRLARPVQGCKPFEGRGAPPWPGCDSNFFATSTDEGRSFQYSSHIDWNPTTMSPKAEGITESSITELHDGRLLSVFRLQSNLPMFKAYSTDQAKTWSNPEKTPTWAV